MVEQLELQASPRELMGKKVRFLRRNGVIPIHVFGPTVASLALQANVADIQRVLSQAGLTGLVALRLSGEAEPRNVMVREIQKNPLTGGLLHVDFFEVSMTEKVRAEVPVVLVGEAPALKTKDNMLARVLDSLVIESMPGQIPSSIELDVSSLVEARQEIRVKNIRLSDRVAIANDPESVIVRISVQRAVKEEEVVAVAPVAEEAAALAEGEAKPEEKAEEE